MYPALFNGSPSAQDQIETSFYENILDHLLYRRFVIFAAIKLNRILSSISIDFSIHAADLPSWMAMPGTPAKPRRENPAGNIS